MTDATIRRLDLAQLIGGGVFFASFFGLLAIASAWREAPNWLTLPMAVTALVSVVAFLAAFFIQGGRKTRENRIESLRSKVAWGVWAAKELERMGVDPFAKG